jgi:signal transduction histidine kinase
MKSIYLLSFILLLNLHAYGSNPKIDSLKIELSKSKIDTTRAVILTHIATEFINISYDSILPYSQKAINLSKTINFQKGKGLGLIVQSTYYYYAGNQKESRAKIEEAVSIFKSLKDNKQLGRAYHNYGILLKNYGESDLAIEKFKLAKSSYEKIDAQQGVVDNLINIGNAFQNKGDFDKALDYFAQARSINDDLKNQNTAASILSGEGIIAENQGDLNVAKSKFTQSLKIFEKLENTRQVLGMSNNLANISRKQGKYLESIDYFEKALSSAKEINNPRLQGIILNNLANTYLDIDDDTTAATLYKQAIAALKDVDRKAYASLLSNLSIIQTNQKQYSIALKTLDTTLTIYKEQGNRMNMANALSSMALNHQMLQDTSKAKSYYYKAKSIAEEIGDKYTGLEVYSGLAEIHLAQKTLDSALVYANKAYRISRDIEALPNESSSAELLFRVYKAQGKYSKALDYLEIHTKLKDSLFDKDKSKALGKLEAELEYNNLSKNLELETEKQLLSKQLEVNKRENYILGLGVGFFLLVIVVILLLWIKRNKSKTNKILKLKNEEIERKNLKLKQSNLQKNKLFSIISHDLRSPVNSLSQIFDLYGSQQISDEEFKSWFPEINKNISSTRLLIDNLLNWASESLNEAQVEKTVLRLKPEIDNLYNFFSSPLRDKNLHFENKIPEDFEMYIDVNTLKLVIRNLISNSVKFCHKGDKISVSATHVEGFDRICVQDTGVGMSDKVAKHLFSNSSIISSIGTNKEEGKGIGTVLCRTFVEENGGSIWVDYSEEGKGTRICFEVPNLKNS